MYLYIYIDAENTHIQKYVRICICMHMYIAGTPGVGGGVWRGWKIGGRPVFSLLNLQGGRGSDHTATVTFSHSSLNTAREIFAKSSDKAYITHTVLKSL